MEVFIAHIVFFPKQLMSAFDTKLLELLDRKAWEYLDYTWSKEETVTPVIRIMTFDIHVLNQNQVNIGAYFIHFMG
jgi:hypothetical protein